MPSAPSARRVRDRERLMMSLPTAFANASCSAPAASVRLRSSLMAHALPRLSGRPIAMFDQIRFNDLNASRKLTHRCQEMTEQ
jgi:hypothetical protein